MYNKLTMFTDEITRQVLIDGKLIEYKCMYEGSLEIAEEFIKNFAPNYLGTSKIIYINGKKQKEEKVEKHFFN